MVPSDEDDFSELDSLSSEMIAKLSKKRAWLFLDHAVENHISVIGVDETVKRLKAYVEHLELYESPPNPYKD